MNKTVKILSLLIVILLQVFAGRLHAQTDPQKRAMMIFNISYAVDWEGEDTLTSYKIGVISSAKEYEALKVLIDNGKKIKNKPVEIERFRRVEDLTHVDILYVTKNFNASLNNVFVAVRGKPILIISDRAKSNIATVINLLPLDKGKKRFEINSRNAAKQHIILSKTILKLGGSEDDLKELYRVSERKLQRERKLLDEKQKQIAEQQRLLEKKEKEIQAKQKESDIKQKQLELKEKEIAIQNMKMDTMSREVQRQKNKLLINLHKIANQEKEKKELDIAIQQQKDDMKKADVLLKQKQASLKKASEEIGQSHQTIESQKDIIYIFIGVTILIIMLIFLALINIYKKKQANRKLNEQNIAINKQKEEISSQAKQLEQINSELEKLSIVAGETDNAVTIMNEKGDFLWVNAGFTRMYGYTLQLLKNEKDNNIIEASTNPNIKEIIKRCIVEKKSVVYEELNTKRDGELLWTQTTVTPIIDTEGNITKLVSIDTNIDKIKEAENEIREQHKMIIEQSRELERKNHELEKLSLIASETDNAILMTDNKGDFVWVNDAYIRMFGFTLEQLKKQVSKNIVGTSTDPNVRELISKVLYNNETVNYEFQAKTKYGNNIWIHTTLTPILNKQGELKNVIAIDTDITKLKKAEFEIRQKSEELLVQKEEIEQINSQMHSSITYAKNIQTAILPTREEMDRFLKSFVIFKPKDIVSGDFYWFAHLPEKGIYKEKIFVATVDCTGHGVPGAFMSMIANQLLNEIVLEQKIVSPKSILEELDKKVKEALRQEVSDNNDGMDLCLCRIENDGGNSFTMKFSGAKRPLYYKHKNDSKIKTLGADRRSIGGTSRKRGNVKFTNQEVTLHQGDMCWLSSDGLIDQNDADRKRLGSPTFVNILNSVCNKPLETQKEVLCYKLAEYQGDEEQRDDITVLGLKLDDRWNKK